MKHFVMAILAATLLQCWGAVMATASPGKGGAAATHGGGQGSDVPVATVNGRKITFGALVGKMRQIQATKYGQEKLTEELGDRLKKEALDKLIIDEIVCQIADSTGVKVPPEKLNAFIAEKKSQHKDEQHFLKYLEVMGMTLDSYRQSSERLLKVQAVVDREINEKISEVPEQDAKRYFDATKEQFVQQEQVQVIDVVFFLDPKDASARKRITAVRDRIEKEFGGDPTKLPQDQLYHVAPDIKLHPQRQAPLFDAAKVLAPNQLSDVIDAGGTLHLVKLTGYKPRVEKTFEQALPTLKKTMLEQQRKQALEKWIATVRGKAEVKIMETTVD